MGQRGKPVKQETDYKENMVAAYIHLAITRHPILLGLVCGYLLRLLTRSIGID